MTLAEMKAQLAAAQAQQSQAQAEAIEMARLQDQLRRLTDDKLQAEQVRMQLEKDITTKLDMFISVCTDKTKADEPRNNLTNKVYQFRAYGMSQKLGKVVNLVTALIAGLRSVPTDYRKVLLAEIAMPEELFDNMSQALGQGTYYDMDKSLVVEGVAGNANKWAAMLDIMADRMGFSSLVAGRIDQVHFDRAFEASNLKAETDKLAHETALIQFETTKATRLQM